MCIFLCVYVCMFIHLYFYVYFLMCVCIFIHLYCFMLLPQFLHVELMAVQIIAGPKIKGFKKAKADRVNKVSQTFQAVCQMVFSL